MSVQTHKTCATCKETKPLEKFHRCGSFSDGRYNHCALCRQARRRIDTPVTRAVTERLALKEEGLKKCNECGEVKLLTDFYVRKSGEVQSCCKVCDVGQAKEHYLSNKEHSDARVKRWREQNPERWATIRRRASMTRRARIEDAFVEVVDPRIVLHSHDGYCGICFTPIIGDFHVDHIIPLALGGEHSYANTQPTHPSCNQRKGSKMFLPNVSVAMG